MTEQKLFAQPNAGEWTELAPGNTRRVLIHTPELMQVEFGFEQGAGCQSPRADRQHCVDAEFSGRYSRGELHGL